MDGPHSCQKYKIHAHHIVMLRDQWYWSRAVRKDAARARAILAEHGISMLLEPGTIRNADNLDELANMTWAINSVDGIHSAAYIQEVARRLEAANTSKRSVLNALRDMGQSMQQHDVFWQD